MAQYDKYDVGTTQVPSSGGSSMGGNMLMTGFDNATSAQGTSNPYSTPNVSPGLDPGRYAFELWYNKRLRDEEQANKDRDFFEGRRRFAIGVGQQNRAQNMGGIQMLAQQRDTAMGRANRRGGNKFRDAFTKVI